MTVWFVSRHPGAIAWVRGKDLAVDRWVAHLDIDAVQPGDTVAGTLPVHLAAEVCARGARYLHLRLELPSSRRGRELSAAEIDLAGARLEAYDVRALAPAPESTTT
ncbi:MAG: CRISPR-associated protein Csx16 [Rubrivivax sp.]|nr:CRISPR-associated protein Csx16 [Rubrivivax sp.]